jgi:copper chaperone NosL
MRKYTHRFYEFLARPPSPGGRVLLAIAAGLLVLTMFFPLWQIRLVAPQYQEGLTLQIYAYKLIAGNNGQDLREINGLNHYIGMRTIEQADFVEMRWVPFALGLFIILALRAAVIGTMSGVLDLLVMYSYFTLFSFGTFYYRLYTYGHELDPKAPVHIQPFTPILIGRQQIANFQQSSLPEIGTLFLALFPILVVLTMWISRKEEP